MTVSSAMECSAASAVPPVWFDRPIRAGGDTRVNAVARLVRSDPVTVSSATAGCRFGFGSSFREWVCRALVRASAILIAQVPSATRYSSGKTSGRTNCGRKWSSRLELATSPMGALATRQGKTL